MKKIFMFVFLLAMSLVSFNTAWARDCVNSSEDWDQVGDHMIFHPDCDSIGCSDNNPFLGYDGYRYISFPDGLTKICANAFNGMHSVESVDLSNRVCN